MKTTIKMLASAVALALFLLLALATQDDDFLNNTNIVGLLILNQSDSCTVKEVNFIHRVRRDNIDTLLNVYSDIEPHDTVWDAFSDITFLKMQYTCACGDSLFFQEVEMVFDSTNYLELPIDCD